MEARGKNTGGFVFAGREGGIIYTYAFQDQTNVLQNGRIVD